MKLAAALVLLGGTAFADPAVTSSDPTIDPAAERAGEANLESTAHREGVTFAAAIGPSFTLGSGAVGTGTGGTLALRLGHVASPSSEVFVELQGAAQFHRPSGTSGVVANNDSNLLIGARYWVGPALWIRGMAGIGWYRGNMVRLDSGATGDVHLVGPAAGFGAGIDLARWRGIVLGLEGYSISMLNRDGLVISSSLALGLSFD